MHYTQVEEHRRNFVGKVGCSKLHKVLLQLDITATPLLLNSREYSPDSRITQK